jgi:hypothetical protein
VQQPVLVGLPEDTSDKNTSDEKNETDSGHVPILEEKLVSMN